MGHPKFEVTTRKNGQFYFNLTAKNGQTILSSEGYTTKSACKNGIESVKTNSQMDERYERKVAKDGQDYFVLKSGNHQVIGTSEMYKSKSGMENGIKSVMENATNADIEDV